MIIQERPEKPDIPWLSQGTWNICCDLEEMVPAFKGITKHIISAPVSCKLGQLEVKANPPEWEGYDNSNQTVTESAENDEGGNPEITGNWNERLSSFQKLIMVKCFLEEKACPFILKKSTTHFDLSVSIISTGGICSV